MTPDYVTPRELYDKLAEVHSRIDDVGDAVSEHKLDTEKGLGRVRLWIAGVGVAQTVVATLFGSGAVHPAQAADFVARCLPH